MFDKKEVFEFLYARAETVYLAVDPNAPGIRIPAQAPKGGLIQVSVQTPLVPGVADNGAVLRSDEGIQLIAEEPSNTLFFPWQSITALFVDGAAKFVWADAAPKRGRGRSAWKE